MIAKKERKKKMWVDIQLKDGKKIYETLVEKVYVQGEVLCMKKPLRTICIPLHNIKSYEHSNN